jgi:hypothetical protein
MSPSRCTDGEPWPRAVRSLRASSFQSRHAPPNGKESGGGKPVPDDSGSEENDPPIRWHFRDGTAPRRRIEARAARCVVRALQNPTRPHWHRLNRKDPTAGAATEARWLPAKWHREVKTPVKADECVALSDLHIPLLGAKSALTNRVGDKELKPYRAAQPWSGKEQDSSHRLKSAPTANGMEGVRAGEGVPA